jgi:AraC family transcriptional regulator, transcriptional activator of pobA
MKKETPHILNSISELHKILNLPGPAHPLISIVKAADVRNNSDGVAKAFMTNFYMVCIKKNYKGQLKYGQNYYDFDGGMLTFISPNQLIAETIAPDKEDVYTGWLMMIHPDFIRNYPLAKNIKSFGYFSYSVTEALHLSEKEESVIDNIINNIDHEISSVIDHYSQDVVVSHLELLFNYSNRFYNRQFITRKSSNHHLLTQVDELLENYFNNEDIQENGLPTVQYVADQLHLSPNYLSDMLRSVTGLSTQQHIHHKLIEKAKEMLSGTTLSVGEVAYQLGFSYSQSFNKLFKSKTNLSPLEFRQSFQ